MLKLKNALEQIFKIKAQTNEILLINRGPQFSRIGAVLGWFVLVFLLFLIIYWMVFHYLLLSLFCFLIGVPIFSFVIDVQGVEFDFAHQKVRTYRSFLLHRSGEWMPLKGFHKIRVLQDTFVQANSGRGSSRKGESFFYYGLYLINDRKQFICLMEHESVTRVKRYAEALMVLTDLDWDDKVSLFPEEHEE